MVRGPVYSIERDPYDAEGQTPEGRKVAWSKVTSAERPA
jgi:hypothetical protein